MKTKNLFKRTLLFAGGLALFLLLAAAALVIYVDPFFHYHRPLKGFPYLIDNQLSQNPGMAQNMEYDSVILGSCQEERQTPSGRFGLRHRILTIGI